jgi:hypothetical protein
VLQRRLTGLLVAFPLIALVACGDEPIEDGLVEPAITALDESRDLACGADGATLRTAIEAYTAMNGEPPRDEAALVEAQLIREATESWDVVDGELVAEHPACGEVGAAAVPPTTVDIATEQEAVDPDEVYAQMSDADVASVGGPDCARELAAIFAAGERYVAEQSADPENFDDLVAAGYLDGLPELWAFSEDRLVPVDGSGCTELAAPAELELQSECEAQAKTIEVAYQAFVAMNDGETPTIEADLVDAGLLRAELDLVDLGPGGAAAPAPGSGCDDYVPL